MSPRPIEPDRPGKPVKPIPGKPIPKPIPARRISIWRSAVNFRVRHNHYQSEDLSQFLLEQYNHNGYFISTLSSKEPDVELYLDLCLPPKVIIKRIDFPYQTEGNNSIEEISLSIVGEEGSYSAISISNANLKSSSGSTFRSEEIHARTDGAVVLNIKTSLRGHGNATSIRYIRVIVEEG